MTQRRLMLVAALATALVLSLPGLAAAEARGLVGISMPTKSSSRWIADGAGMVRELQAKGYKTDLQYADDGMSILGIGIDYQQVINGCVLLAAVFIDVHNRARR